MTGFLACTEPRPDGGPPIPGATVADSAGGGLHAVVAILAALVRRSMGGDGQYLDVSAAEGVLSLMSLSLDQFLATDEVAGPRQVLLTGRYAFYDVYPCRDGKWISVGAIEPRFYRNLCQRLDLEQYAEQQMNDDVQDEIRAAFREVFLTRERDAWVAELAPNDTCVAPVYDDPRAHRGPASARARRLHGGQASWSTGSFRQVAPILAGGVREQPVHRGAAPWARPIRDALLECAVGYRRRTSSRALRDDGAVE